jgi:hypothetical protein
MRRLRSFFREVIGVTNAQKKLAGDLRAAGQSYKQIAATLGISINTIKSFCRRGNLARHDASKETESKRSKDTCKQCETCLPQHPGLKHRTFCSAECRVRWWSKNRSRSNGRASVLKRCAQCGSVFRSQASANRKFCGHACFVTARYRKEARHDARTV